MARPCGTKARGNPAIASLGAKAAGVRRDETRELVLQAMRKIVKEIEKNRGVYPWANGELSAAEVLRRAGRDRFLLQKPRHAKLRRQVNQWVVRTRRRMANGAEVVRDAVTERADDALQQTALLRQRLCEAELEHAEREGELARLMARCDALEAELTRLRSTGSGEANMPRG